jgi:uncharacterized protein
MLTLLYWGQERRLRMGVLIRYGVGILLLSLSCLLWSFGRASKAPSAKSLKSLRERAQRGDAIAQFLLGVKYDLGQGVVQDVAEAARWYRKAAEQGYAPAQVALGLMYALGGGMAQDCVEAHLWINLAASHASGNHQKRYYTDLREAFAGLMTAGQIAEAQRRAWEWEGKIGENLKRKTRQ